MYIMEDLNSYVKALDNYSEILGRMLDFCEPPKEGDFVWDAGKKEEYFHLRVHAVALKQDIQFFEDKLGVEELEFFYRFDVSEDRMPVVSGKLIQIQEKITLIEMSEKNFHKFEGKLENYLTDQESKLEPEREPLYNDFSCV